MPATLQTTMPLRTYLTENREDARDAVRKIVAAHLEDLIDEVQTRMTRRNGHTLFDGLAEAAETEVMERASAKGVDVYL